MNKGALTFAHVFCHKPLLEALLLNINWADALGLAHAFPRARAALSWPRAARARNARLEAYLRAHMGTDARAVELVMEAVNAGLWALTGSALLDAVYEANWDNIGDLDILMLNTPESIERAHAFLDYTHAPYVNFQRAERNDFTSLEHYPRGLLSAMKTRCKFGMTFQFLLLKEGATFDAHVRTYDMQFVQNYYTTRQLHCQEPASVATRSTHMIPYTFYAIPGKFSDDLNITIGFLINRYRRYKGYRARGFVMEFEEIPEKDDENYMQCRAFWNERVDGATRQLVKKTHKKRRIK